MNTDPNKKGWPNRTTLITHPLNRLVDDVGRCRDLSRLGAGVRRNRLHPRSVKRLIVLSLSLRLIGGGSHLQHLAATFKHRALFDNQRRRLNVAVYLGGATGLKALRRDNVALNGSVNDGDGHFDIGVDLTIRSHDERTA